MIISYKIKYIKLSIIAEKIVNDWPSYIWMEGDLSMLSAKKWRKKMNRENGLINQMQERFQKEVEKDVPGWSWNGFLIHSYGNGRDNQAGEGDACRLVCWSQDGKSDPIIRTTIDYPLIQGMMILIPDDDRFFLIKRRPQKMPDSWKAVGVACNSNITVYCLKPDIVSVEGYLLEEGGRSDYIWNFPCIREQSIGLSSGNGTPGTISQREEIFTLQQNDETATIQIKDKVVTDGHTFTITDVVKGEHGIMRLFCQSDAGGVTT